MTDKVYDQNTQDVGLINSYGFEYQYIGEGETHIRLGENIASIHVTDFEISVNFRINIERGYAVYIKSKKLLYVKEVDKHGFKINCCGNKPKKIRFEKLITVYLGISLDRVIETSSKESLF